MKDVPECRTAVLKLKLGSCTTGPTKRMVADLHEAARLANVARNAMVRYWERWCEDHPDEWADGKIKLPQSFSTVLYHAGREQAPALASIVTASYSNTLMSSHLMKKTPFGHAGVCRRVWHAILMNELPRPCFREHGLAAPCKTTTIRYGTDHATLSFALWSKAAGRKNTQCTCRILIKRMPAGLKKIIRMVVLAKDGWRLCDSELVWKEGKRRGRGTWFYHMCYQRQPLPVKLTHENIARLVVLSDEASHPFQMETDTTFPVPVGQRPPKPWSLGDVGVLKSTYARIDARRVNMRNRYRDAGSSRQGHGRERIESAIRPVSRAAHDLALRFVKNLVAQVIKFCVRYDCGTLIYDEPRVRQRVASWFVRNSVPFDWTRMRSQLDHRCWLHGIRIVASGEVADGPGGEPGAGDGPKGGSGGGVATKAKAKRRRAGSRGPKAKVANGVARTVQLVGHETAQQNGHHSRNGSRNG